MEITITTTTMITTTTGRITIMIGGSRWHQPRSAVVDYGSVSVGGVGTRVSAPSAPCNCLTKRYLDDGSVVFADLCTREQAMATPAELRAQAEGIVPQGDAPTTR